MEENFRRRMMPAYEQFIKALSTSFGANSSTGCDLWRLEIEVTKAVAVMALQALWLLIELAHGRGYEGSQRECGNCGGRMKFESYRERRLLSTFGSLNYERAYYCCGHCRHGTVPLDERLGLGGRSVTPRLQRLIAFFGGHLSFGVVKKALWESHQLEINREVVRQVAEESGGQALNWEQAEAARHSLQELAASKGAAKTWIIECDGKKVGFQDGSWHEVKVGVIYELQARVESSRGRQELMKREIVPTLPSG